MAITKAFLGNNGTGGSSVGSVAVSGLDTTNYTHIVVMAGHNSQLNTITFSDNKSSTYTELAQQTFNNHTARIGWAEIGSPGTSTTVTATVSSNSTFLAANVWGVNADSGVIEVVDQTYSNASQFTFADAGDLDNASNDSVVSFYGFNPDGVVTYTVGSGWTLDQDTDAPDSYLIGQSRGAETTGTIPCEAGISGSVGGNVMGVCFREVVASAIGPIVGRHLQNLMGS